MLLSYMRNFHRRQIKDAEIQADITWIQDPKNHLQKITVDGVKSQVHIQGKEDQFYKFFLDS